MMKVIPDRYNGVTVDINTLPNTRAEFEREIVELLKSFKDKKLLWINIPIENTDYIPVLTGFDFEFHHCSKKSLMLVKQLQQECTIPSAATHTVGVGAVVQNGDQILVVKDRFSSGYKLPGGYIESNESIKEAIKREVVEETGIMIEFESIANIGHFMNGQFGEASLYFVCTAKATNKKITIYDSSEILEAKWIDLDIFLNSTDTNSFNKSVVKTVFENKDLKLTDQAISLRVRGEVFS
jgi:8-oxo-dGTP diphosphatase